MNPATATRAEIREFVRLNSEEILEFASTGGNPHQKSLDQKDLLEERLSSLTDEQRDRFYSIYAEELHASNEHALHKLKSAPSETVDISPQDSKVEIGTQSWGGILILVAVVVAAFLVAIKMMR